jgi:hypothetical protein
LFGFVGLRKYLSFIKSPTRRLFGFLSFSNSLELKNGQFIGFLLCLG